MIDDLLSRIFAQHWTVFLLIAPLLFAEAGFRFGLRLRSAHDEARKGQIGGIQGAVLGLLGLLLGFTCAMAVNRYELRRELVVKEANAIGTTYLRASLLPDAHEAPVRDLLPAIWMCGSNTRWRMKKRVQQVAMRPNEDRPETARRVYRRRRFFYLAPARRAG